MASESTRQMMTYDEYMALPEGFYNLVEGELIVSPTPNLNHQMLQAHLLSALFTWNREKRAGRVVGAPSDVILRKEHPAIVVQPDILFVAKDGRARLTKAGTTGAPDLVVEIVSPSSMRLDGVRKRALYEQFGAREFWLVLPDLDQVEVMRLGPDGRFGTPRLLGVDDQLESPLLPGFGLSLAELFAVFEDYDE
jgi:Uma2 family endonuclease